MLGFVGSSQDTPSIAGDVAAGAMSALTISTIWMNWVDSLIKIAIGILTIILLYLRIRAHLRK